MKIHQSKLINSTIDYYKDTLFEYESVDLTGIATLYNYDRVYSYDNKDLVQKTLNLAELSIKTGAKIYYWDFGDDRYYFLGNEKCIVNKIKKVLGGRLKKYQDKYRDDQ